MLSAVPHSVFLGLRVALRSQVAPRTYALTKTSPRLAALGLLALWRSPFAFAVVVLLERATEQRAKRGEA